VTQVLTSTPTGKNLGRWVLKKKTPTTKQKKKGKVKVFEKSNKNNETRGDFKRTGNFRKTPINSKKKRMKIL